MWVCFSVLSFVIKFKFQIMKYSLKPDNCSNPLKPKKLIVYRKL